MALEHAQERRRRVSSVVLIWPSTSLPPQVRELLEGVKYTHGARVAAIKIQPDAVERIMDYLDKPDEEVSEVHRSLVEYMRHHGVRELPALIVDGRLVAAGDGVVETLQRLLYTPAIA